MEGDKTNTGVGGYFLAVWQEWKVLVSGGAGIVVLLGLAERLSGKNISWPWYVSLLALLVLWACFRAWQGERRTALRVSEELAKKHRPQLKVIIRQAAVGVTKERDDLAVITIFASIRNLGMPSIATGWSLLVKVPEKGLLLGALHYTTGRLIMGHSDRGPIIHPNEDALYNKLAERPLQTGGEVTGFLVFHLEGVRKEDVFRAATVFVLACEDVTERTCFAVHEPFVQEGPPKFFPGMKSVAHESQLEKRDKYNLTFEVDTSPADAVKLHRQQRLIAGAITDAHIIIANFKIRFINQSLDPLSVMSMKALFVREGEDGSETEIPTENDSYTSLQENGRPVDLENSHILGIRMTPYYELKCLLIVLVNYVEEVNEKCFLRITMEAMRQPPYAVDLEVADWGKAGGEGGSPIRPRTPV